MSYPQMKVTDKEIIDFIESHEDQAVTAVEIAEEFSISTTGINKRLNALHDDGVLEKKRVGSRAVVWWIDQS